MSLATLSFMRPWWLLALLPLGLLLWRLWRAPDSGEAAWRQVVDAHLLPHLLVFSGARTRRTGVALLAGGLMAAVLALAGPALEAPPQAVLRRDVTRLLVLDLSPGMVRQLEQVKLKLLALLQAWPDGQTALLVYGGEPYLVVPPTTDSATIALFVPELAIDAIPVPGNHPERALRMAGNILARSHSQQREVLWITAGAGGAELPLADLAGARLSILHAAAVDDPTLIAAAHRSGGAVVRLRADDADIRQLVNSREARVGWIAGPATATTAKGADLGHWLLLPLLPLAALAFRRGILALLLPLLLAGLLAPQPAAAFDFPLAAMWSDYQAWRLLEAGEAQAAAAGFADPRWRAAAHYRAGQFDQAASVLAGARDAESCYNRGNALARQGQLTGALAAYDAALTLRADDADTRH
ncbi:MAG: VWA domain-containing protein, partial [Polaromonas sp.]